MMLWLMAIDYRPYLSYGRLVLLQGLISSI